MAQQSDKRFALVIGNAAYSGALTPLRNPGADADRIAGALGAVGFNGRVAVRKDQTRAQILNEARALADRLRAAGPDAIGFLYYSGHGGSAVEGDKRRNYLIPVGSAVSKADDLVAEGVPLDTVVAILSAAKARAVFIVFDACRNELPWSKGGDDADKAFGAVPARPGLFIAFATDQGATAPDDGAFSQAIAAEIVKPGQEHLKVFDNAARSVARRRATDRLPWYSNQIFGDPVYFQPASVRSDAPPELPFDARAADTAYWQGCCTGATTTIADLEAYLAKVRAGQFPGLFKDLAERKMANLKAPPTVWASVPDRTAATSPPAAATKFRSGSVFRDCPTCPEMVVIPAGSFVMGSPASEPGRNADESPQRTVQIGAFAAGRFEVTFDEWDGCVAEGGCETKPADQGWGRGKRPVINVSWNDAKAYTSWLSRKTGQRYRLLTEAEWEYAARAGTTSAYWWGPAIGSGNANCDGCGSQWDNSKTAPVGAFQPNAFGLFDTAGNVWEWVEDCYVETYAGAPTDGSAVAGGACASRVLRGGSWYYIPQNLRSAFRGRSTPAYRDDNGGFRLARTVSPSDR